MSRPTVKHFLKLLWDVDVFDVYVFNINALTDHHIFPLLLFYKLPFVKTEKLKKKKKRGNFMKCVCSFPNYLNLNNHALELYFSKASVYNCNRNCTELFCSLSTKSRIISNAMKKFGCPTLYS